MQYMIHWNYFMTYAYYKLKLVLIFIEVLDLLEKSILFSLNKEGKFLINNSLNILNF